MSANLPEGLVAAPLRLEDLDDVAMLVQLVDLRTLGQIEASPSELRSRIASPDVDAARDGVVVRIGERPVVGYLLARPHTERKVLLETYSHPEFWDDDELDRWLLVEAITRATRRAADSGLPDWRAVVLASAEDLRVDLLEELGFVEAGEHLRMEARFDRRAPDVPLPPTITLRNPRGDDDLERVHDVFAQAFAARPDTRPDEWANPQQQRIRQGEHDHSLWFIAENQSGAMLGACVAEADAQARFGRVLLLGVLPGARGRGVGTGLLNATFRALHARGIGRAELGVDVSPVGVPIPSERRGEPTDIAPSHRVTALYERAGMHPIFTLTRFELAL